MSAKLHGADAMPIAALTAGDNVKVLIEQALAMKPKLAVIGNEQLFGELKAGLAGTGIEVAAGRQAVIEAAAVPSDFVMVAIMGAAAIEPALAAIRRGVVVALANKECVVAAGEVFRDAMEKSGAQVLPVDSEHNAIFQVLGSGDASRSGDGHHHRLGRPVPRMDAGAACAPPRWKRRWPIPTGRWAARSRSTAPP